jgi:hypothetical protein
MRLTYGDLELGEVKKLSGHVFVHLRQRIDCKTADGDNYGEVRLFGFTPGDSQITRKLLYQVPEGTGIYEFEEILDSYPGARIIRTISHEPVVSLTDREFVRGGLISIESIARRQLVRDRETVYTDRYGMPVYAQNKLSLTGQFSDTDYRLHSNDAWIQVHNTFDDELAYTTE